jgi:hypothetical protein
MRIILIVLQIFKLKRESRIRPRNVSGFFSANHTIRHAQAPHDCAHVIENLRLPIKKRCKTRKVPIMVLQRLSIKRQNDFFY